MLGIKKINKNNRDSTLYLVVKVDMKKLEFISKSLLLIEFLFIY